MRAFFAQPFEKMWAWVRDKDNREMVSWVCGGLAVLAGAVWAVFTYFVHPESTKQQVTPPVDCTIEANYSLAACGGINVDGSINITGGDKVPKETK
jgi:hypothetical protein